MGYRSKGHNPAAWNNNLEHTLANPSKLNAAKVKHHAALPIDDMSAFWQRLCHADGVGAKALKFLILTAARSSEARGALWSEIDLDGASGRSPPLG